MIKKLKFQTELSNEFNLTLEHNLLTILDGSEIVAQGFVDNVNDFINIIYNNDISYDDILIKNTYNQLLGQ